MKKNGLSRPPLVTVVMPAYNASQFIRQSIESILNQNFRRFELIVIDDCSQDDTYRIIKEYKQDPRVRIYQNRQRLGDAETRNRILNLARGKYIAPHDADDIMLQGGLKEQWEFLEKNQKIGVVFGKALVSDEKMRNILNVIAPKKVRPEEFVSRSGLIKKLPVGFNHGTALIRKKHIFKAGLYEASLPLGVDSRLMRRIFRITPFYFLNKFCFIYRQQSQSICRRRLRESRKAMDKIFRKPGKKYPAGQVFYINGEWVKVEAKTAAMAKTLGWRLNFYSWQAERQGRGGKKRFLEWQENREETNNLSDSERFRQGFLIPFSARLRAEGKILLDQAGLVSFHEKGILIFAEENVRAQILLLFLNRDFHYHSGNNPILYGSGKNVYGQSFVDPLMISRPIFKKGRRQESWGQFWNPILRKYFLNVCFYRTHLIGNECRIIKMFFIQKEDSVRNIRTKKLNVGEIQSLLHANGNAQLSQWGPEASKVLETMIHQTPAFLINAPQDKLRQVVLEFSV